MAAIKTPAEKNSFENEKALDKHFELAFKEISKILKQLMRQLAKDPALTKSKGIRSYSKSLQGFVQNNVSKKQAFRVTVNIDTEFDKALEI